MRLRDFETGLIWQGELTKDNSASCYGQPVLVLQDGLALSPLDVARDFTILDASAEELAWCGINFQHEKAGA